MNKLRACLILHCECLTGFATGRTPIWHSWPDSFILWLWWITGQTERQTECSTKAESCITVGKSCPIWHSLLDSFISGWITDQSGRIRIIKKANFARPPQFLGLAFWKSHIYSKRGTNVRTKNKGCGIFCRKVLMMLYNIVQ